MDTKSMKNPISLPPSNPWPLEWLDKPCVIERAQPLMARWHDTDGDRPFKVSVYGDTAADFP